MNEEFLITVEDVDNAENPDGTQLMHGVVNAFLGPLMDVASVCHQARLHQMLSEAPTIIDNDLLDRTGAAF